jgi:hypothetical protein
MRGYMTSARPLSPLAPLVIVHAIAFTAWIALFLAQAGLISARQHKLHMRLGMATVGLAVIIVVLGLADGGSVGGDWQRAARRPSADLVC